MDSLAGYKIETTIQENRFSTLYRGTAVESGEAVVLELFDLTRATASELARFRQAYERFFGLELEGVIPIYDLVLSERGVAVVREYFDGIPLAHILADRPAFSLTTFLDVALSLAETLGELHAQDLMHLAINPVNILMSRDWKTVKLTGFGIANLITHATDKIYDSEVIARVLPYLSPEQTGRMNRSVDYRTDMYSLGLTLYAILSGKPPFKSDDPMKVVHAHIAVEAVPLETIDPDIPTVISMIIQKLLSKDPENRYQNGFGLMSDLDRCRRSLEETGSIAPFPLAENDRSPRFIIPQKLFGREKEVEFLLSQFEVSASREAGPCLMVISGPPGIGKSTLIQEIQKPILARSGYFISGKFEQFRQDKPYTAIAQAFQAFVKQLLSGRPEVLRQWKQRVASELGPYARVIADVIPDLESITGALAALEYLGPEESKHRFNYVFERFVSMCTSKDHSLTLFLDDAQWADPSSFDLLQHLLSGRGPGHFFLILSFRDNEVDLDHPLMHLVTSLAKNESLVLNSIILSPLTKTDIEGLMEKLLQCTPTRARGLAGIVHEKTDGNPFFMHQLLYTLHDEKIIQFHPMDGWTWDDIKVRDIQVTENLLDLMEERISRLPSPALDILKITACFGNELDLESLADVNGKSLEETLQDMKPALDEGYLKVTDGRLYHHHDRIQEAAYRLIPDHEKPGYHYRIGKRLLEISRTPKDRQDNLFHIADQLNQARALIKTDDERTVFRDLNFEAGQKAKASAAYGPAGIYFENARALLTENAWREDYKTTLSVFEECADAACLSGNYPQMETYAGIILRHTASVLERVRITDIGIRALFAVQDYAAAVKKGLDLLEDLGFDFPRRITKRHILMELIKVKRSLKDMDDRDILDLPDMTDPRHLAIVQTINAIGVSASLTDPNLYGLMILKRILITLKFGKSPWTGIGFTAYGGFLIAALGDIPGGIRFGDLSLKMADRPEGKLFKQRIFVTYDLFIRHWKEDILQCETASRISIKTAHEAGDQPYVGLAYAYGDFVSMASGGDIDQLWNSIYERYLITRQNKQQAMTQMHGLALQWATNVTGKSEDLVRLSGEFFDAETVLPEWIEKKNLAGLVHYYTLCMTLSFMAYQYEDSYRHLLNGLAHHQLVKAMLINHLLTCYSPIVRLARCHQLSGYERKGQIRKATATQNQIRKWARIEPTKNLPWVHLIEAEKAWLAGKDMQAQAHFDSAIEGFDRAPNPMFKAMALERAALYYRDRSRENLAGFYFQEAFGLHERLGLNAKMALMKKEWPHIHYHGGKPRASIFKMSPSLTERRSISLDYSTVIKGAIALSSEIDLNRLIERIMRLAIENAGAQHGFLILENKDTGGYDIKASGKADRSVEVFASLPVEAHPDLPLSLLDYVFKTGENVILDDAARDTRFAADPHIISRKPKSILCGPIRHKGLVAGILYLENNLTTAAFSEARMRLLTLLSSQAAISIENARLFAEIRRAEQNLRQLNLELEQRVVDRTMALNQSLKQVEDANREFLSSLNYSRVIQTALLPDRDRMASLLPRSFSVWHPRDIIGGDIYFFEVLQDGFLLAVIDCTGHGVPGAFMTTIASSGWRRIITDEKEVNPSVILEKLNRFIRTSLQQDGENPHSNDGLDAAVCRFDRRKDTLTFSGAGLPLYYVVEDQVHVVKGDRHHIGYVHSDPNYVFTAHTLERPDRNTCFYMMTDGFVDQLGHAGEKRQRFGSKRLKSLLLDCRNQPFAEQKKTLINRINDFRGDHPQIDDITLVGFGL